MAFFNQNKYLPPQKCYNEDGGEVPCDGNEHRSEDQSMPFPLIDGSDVLADEGGLDQVISFYQVNGNRSISFKAFITTYNETWKSDWAQEPVYGRTDPIYMFKQNSRNITLVFKVPAASQGEAYENLTKVQRLVQFIYPSYSSVTTGPIPAQTISRAPLIRLNVLGMTQKQLPEGSGVAYGGGGGQGIGSKPGASSGFHKGRGRPEDGLLGVIQNLTVNHNLDNTDYGVFHPSEIKNTILPKFMEVNLVFDVIHEFTLGWGENNDFSSHTYPFNVDILDDEFYWTPQETQEADQVAAAAGEEDPADTSATNQNEDEDVPPEQTRQNELAAKRDALPYGRRRDRLTRRLEKREKRYGEDS